MSFHIKADNPKGLKYDEVHETAERAAQVIRRIAAQGGENITVNGQELDIPA